MFLPDAIRHRRWARRANRLRIGFCLVGVRQYWRSANRLVHLKPDQQRLDQALLLMEIRRIYRERVFAPALPPGQHLCKS